MIKLVIFDLDGTIFNTIEDLATATNLALSSYGYPTHSIEAYKYFVGNGIPNLIMCALPEDRKTKQECDKVRGRMLDYYKDHFADKSAPYDGIMDMLKTLKDGGVRLAVCTNKAHYMAVKIVEGIFGGIFEKVIGQSTDRPLKPDPFSVFEIMELFGAAPEETVFVGDSGVDMQIANNAGIKGIGVLWGFRTEKELKENGGHYIVATPSEITEIINKL